MVGSSHDHPQENVVFLLNIGTSILGILGISVFYLFATQLQ